jgi:MFS family permease
MNRSLWFVVAGMFINYLGYGAVLPFEIIYLHDARGFEVGTAGLIIGVIMGAAVVTAPVAGPLIDRFGARATGGAAGLTLAVGYAGLAWAPSVATAFGAAALAGAGNGALFPSQSTLLTTLAPPELRHRATAVSRAAANAGAGIGGVAGGLVAAYGTAGLLTLFLVNAATYLIYAGILVAAVPGRPAPEPRAGGYAVVVRDRALIRLAAINVAVIAVGWGVFSWLLPAYAEYGLDVQPRLIGVLLLVNAATVAAAQLPIARSAEGRRRVVTMAQAAATFAGAYLLVLAAGRFYPALILAAVAVGIGECLHTTVLVPLAADLAPAALRGRYLATVQFSWWLGLALAPAAGAQLLSASPTATFAVAALVAAAAGTAALALERTLPTAARLTPRPSGTG